MKLWRFPKVKGSLLKDRVPPLWPTYIGEIAKAYRYEIHWTLILQIMFLVSLESSQRGGVHGLGSMTFGLAVQKVFEYWMIFSLKIKLNQIAAENFGGLGMCVPLVLLERSWWVGFNEIDLVRFGFKMWEILTFKCFLPLKIRIQFQKTRFWKEKLVEDVVTLQPTATWGCLTSPAFFFFQLANWLAPQKNWNYGSSPK
jgi:hypothetical protein